MHRQLKQTAFFGTDRGEAGRRPLNGWRYKTRGKQPACADVPACDMVGGASEPASDALEEITGGAVALVDQPAFWTLPAGVPGIDKHDRRSASQRLVAHHAALLMERPVVQSSPLAPRGLNPVADTLKVFEGYSEPVALGDDDDCFGNAVVNVALEPGLPAGGATERTLGGAGSFLLEGAAAYVMASADPLKLSAAERPAVAVSSEVNHAEIYPEHVNRRVLRGFVYVAGDGEHPLAAHEHQVNLSLGTGEHFSLVWRACEGDALAAVQGPDRDGFLPRKETEDALIERLGGMAAETPAAPFVPDLKGVRYLSDAPHGDLRREPESPAQFRVAEPVQIVLPRDLGGRSERCQPVACGVAPFQRLTEDRGLFHARRQTDGCDELHELGTFLCFDIAANNGLGDDSDRSDVIGSRPQSRKSGANLPKLCTQRSARRAFQTVNDFGWTKGRISFHEKMHMVRHNFDVVQGNAMRRRRIGEHFLQAAVNRWSENIPPILGAEYDVVLEAEYRPRVVSIASAGPHGCQYIGDAYIAQERRAGATASYPSAS